MARILVIYENRIATVSILQEMLPKIIHGAEVLFCRSIKVTSKMVDHADVILMIRPMDVCSLFIAKAARKAGVFLIFFCDDDLLGMPDTYPHIPWRYYSMKHTLAVSNAVISSSSLIRRNYGKRTVEGRSAAIDTVVTAREIKKVPVLRQEIDVVKIVYAAGGNHEELFYEYVEPVCKELDARFGNRISLTFVGVHPKMERYKYSFPINYVKSMPLDKYRAYMRRERFDVGLAPLHDNRVSACKYYNKFIEYTLVGAVGVYSKVKPYTFVVQDGVNGYFADNTKEGWLSAVTRAVEDIQGRRRCLLNAIEQLQENHNTEKIRKRLLAEIPELETHRAHKKKCRGFLTGKILYKASWFGDRAYLFVFYLKRDGVKPLAERVKEHIRVALRCRS